MDTAKFYADAFGEHYFATESEGLTSNWLELFGYLRVADKSLSGFPQQGRIDDQPQSYDGEGYR